MMKEISFPKTEWLMHNRTNLLTPAQRARYDAMVRLSDLLNRAMRDDMERTTGRYLPMLFTDFLEKLYRAVGELERQGETLLIDDFIRIARFSLPAIKHITSQPSTQIVKNMEKVPVSRVQQTASGTMRWLAKRPGRSIGEKIAPRNQVLTAATHFSADTKENRETIYLYEILYDVVRSRLKDNEAALLEQDYSTKELQDLLALHIRIRRSDLADVPPVKQTMQNNKLMCDKYYKMVWDAVRQLSTVEEKLKCDWQQVEERYLQIGYWIVLARILHSTETVIHDRIGNLHDENGRLWFGDREPESRDRETLFPLQKPERPLVLRREGSKLILESDGGILIHCVLPVGRGEEE